MERIGFGGGCHWCTEAVFQSLVGVAKVAQGFVAPKEFTNDYSEAVLIDYEPQIIDMATLVEVHLRTHKSTKEHQLREKYRSAIYVYDDHTFAKAVTILKDVQKNFKEPLITKVFEFGQFKWSDAQFHNYYYSNPQKPFCERYIAPKLALLQRRFSKVMIDKDQ